MSDHQPNTFLPNDPPPRSNLEGLVATEDDRVVPGIIYGLYILPLGGVSHLIGLVMAYIFRDSAPEWQRSHYSYLIRTFWMGLAYCVLCVILTFTLIGAVSWAFLWLWFVIRCAVGIARLLRREPIANPTTWLI